MSQGQYTKYLTFHLHAKFSRSFLVPDKMSAPDTETFFLSDLAHFFIYLYNIIRHQFGKAAHK